MNNQPLLTVQDLTMRFSGILALNKVNFTVNEGTITALIGPNGAGKTTLFNCLTGFYRPTHGEILLSKQHTLLNLQTLLGEPFKIKHFIPLQFFPWLYYKMLGGSHLVTRQGIVRTFQNNRLFQNMTVLENLLVAQHIFAPALWQGIFKTSSYNAWHKRALAIAYQWLDLFDLTPVANRLALELPYGKQRHAEIARAMCTNPTLLCLDEPAAGLNPSETQHLKDIILFLRQNYKITILLIEHDMTLIMNISDKIIVLDHGEIICEDSPINVAQNEKVIKAYLGKEDDD